MGSRIRGAVRRTAPIFVAAFLLAPTAGPSGATESRADNYVFAGGGSPVTNGIFFPGTAVYDDQSKEFTGEPYTIPKGTDVTFVNLDAGVVANGHSMVSIKKRKRTGRPLFSSPVLDEPGEQALVITSHLRPGLYPYRCDVHFGMFGQLRIEG